MTHAELLEDLTPTITKILSKREITNWCLSYNYKKETIEDINNIINENKDGFIPLDYSHPNRMHIKAIEKMHGGKPNYMHPISVKFKLYKFVTETGKSFILQSVGDGYFLIRTAYNSYKFIY